MIRGRTALAAAACLSAACRADPSPAPPAPAAAQMPAGVVARVGDLDVTADTVARVAAAQRIPLDRARDAAIRDALLAAGARARGLHDDPALRAQIQAVLARRVLRQLLDDAR
ncbi:MAG: peptidylprolyl isomerase, partial [Polyangiaceae bacterium]|nr:peptidylprolyl isomerase [Polyangiaceae bacterium]